MPVETAKLTHAGRTVKFGRIPARPEMLAAVPPLRAFVKRYGGTPPPAKVDYAEKARPALALMLGNDRYGDCVIAATHHGVGVWTANEPGGAPAVLNATETVAEYKRICGPGDNGCFIPRVLDTFRDRGILAGGKQRRIEGYVRINPRDQMMVKIGAWAFGGLHLGVNWPSTWMDDARPGGVLKPGGNRFVGGHAVQVVGYDSVGLQISTWGIVCTMSWEALADPRYVDECYAMLSDDWFNDQGATAAGAGVDVVKLRAAMDAIKRGEQPTFDTDPPVPPPVPPGGWDFEHTFPIALPGLYAEVHVRFRRTTPTFSETIDSASGSFGVRPEREPDRDQEHENALGRGPASSPSWFNPGARQ